MEKKKLSKVIGSLTLDFLKDLPEKIIYEIR